MATFYEYIIVSLRTQVLQYSTVVQLAKTVSFSNLHYKKMLLFDLQFYVLVMTGTWLAGEFAT